ncbi:unnamed protein product [Didymodactylos carnosus]|uniref:Tetratricopeptide repeat protein n=1 Tax=Didymodactylos carnosus TaxID=1234261 RepID=A0A8S2EZX3_9BILA|nr:unnamed protein product [Didymodactylos carnosus]CAF4169557.1 unnamed protein product [Didymodactylos carnosus]
MGKKRKALNNYQRAIEIQYKHLPQSQSGLSLSFIDMGLYYTKNGEYQTAFHYFKRAVESLVDCIHRRDNYLSLANFYLGIAYSHLDKYHEAIECHKKALRIYLDSEMSYNRQYIKSVYCHLGLSHFRTEKYDDALECFNTVIEKETDVRQVAVACYYIGSVYHHRGNFEQSLKWYLNSLENVKNASMKSNVLHNTGVVYMSMNLIEDSIKFFNNALNSEMKFVSEKYPSITKYYNYMHKLKDSCELLNETTLVYHQELDIVTHLFESRHKTPSTFEIIWFDPDNSSYSFSNITRLCSNAQLVEYLATCKAQTIFVITYSNLTVQLNYSKKRINIYLLLVTNETLVRDDVRGSFSDVDQLLTELINDLVKLEMDKAYIAVKIDERTKVEHVAS